MQSSAPRPRPGIPTIACFCLLAVSLLIVSAFLGSADTSIHSLSASAFTTSMALLCLAWAGAARSHSPMNWLQLNPPLRPLPTWGVVAAVLGMLGLSYLLDAGLRASGLREASVLARIDGLLAGASGGDLILAAVALALVPALGEEIFFRGLMLGRLREFLGAPKGLILSSLLFGALHMDVAQGVAAALLGLYLGLLTLRTGSVHTALLCHGFNNLVAILGLPR